MSPHNLNYGNLPSASYSAILGPTFKAHIEYGLCLAKSRYSGAPKTNGILDTGW